MSRCLIAEYDHSEAAKAGLEILEKNGFTLENVSVVSNVSDPAAEHLHELHDLPQHGSADTLTDDRNTTLGMLIGGSLAAPIAAGTLIGPFIIAGPLVGMALGAAVGSLLKGTKKWGVEHDVAADYEERVREGAVLIIVNAHEDARLNEAQTLLDTTSPRSIEAFQVTD
ncbi:DUF1269 domain-containing protein [Roseimaritima ulvae]|uniref:DUF1269 domain-containing protein n=1 Tax=Roseimaritima ulvae TaxID=980254 RepID=A0A5B9R0E8_9BACT|nr:DUF1269 domain-containing protein [Roseimaritima ulvae]QEG39743.1 hypothetical protein UC8_17410 [Roseimaritima ulvae]